MKFGFEIHIESIPIDIRMDFIKQIKPCEAFKNKGMRP